MTPPTSLHAANAAEDLRAAASHLRFAIGAIVATKVPSASLLAGKLLADARRFDELAGDVEAAIRMAAAGGGRG